MSTTAVAPHGHQDEDGYQGVVDDPGAAYHVTRQAQRRDQPCDPYPQPRGGLVGNHFRQQRRKGDCPGAGQQLVGGGDGIVELDILPRLK